jgi:hypothetical protein
MRIAPREQEKLLLHQVTSLGASFEPDLEFHLGRFSRPEAASPRLEVESNGGDCADRIAASRAHTRWGEERESAYGPGSDDAREKTCLSIRPTSVDGDHGGGHVQGWVGNNSNSEDTDRC